MKEEVDPVVKREQEAKIVDVVSALKWAMRWTSSASWYPRPPEGFHEAWEKNRLAARKILEDKLEVTEY